jgi:hypothetical protein
VALCSRALELLPRLPPGRERDLIELRILETMCRHVSSNSFSAAFTGREPLALYARAIEIARSLADPTILYAAITRLCNYHMLIAEYDRSAEVSAELDALEREHELDPGQLHSGIFARGYVAFFRGDQATALRQFQRMVPEAHEASPFHAMVPGRALALGHIACVHWVVGEPDRALEEANATIELADTIEHPVLQALGHAVRARLRFLRCDPLAIVEQEAPLAARATAIDHGLHTEARAVALWAQARRSPLELAAIQPMLDSLQERMTQVSTCSTLLGQILIEALRISGHTAEARKLTDQVITFATEHNESVYLPGLLRIRGELERLG